VSLYGAGAKTKPIFAEHQPSLGGSASASMTSPSPFLLRRLPTSSRREENCKTNPIAVAKWACLNEAQGLFMELPKEDLHPIPCDDSYNKDEHKDS
jgi:hypothetical protein